MSTGVSVKQERPDIEAVVGDGDADLLLDTILRNALGTDDGNANKGSAKTEGTKKEGVKESNFKKRSTWHLSLVPPTSSPTT